MGPQGSPFLADGIAAVGMILTVCGLLLEYADDARHRYPGRGVSLALVGVCLCFAALIIAP